MTLKEQLQITGYDFSALRGEASERARGIHSLIQDALDALHIHQETPCDQALGCAIRRLERAQALAKEQML